MPEFTRHARNVSLLTMVSRVTGLARDASLSRVFGAGGITDAFFLAFMIPNLFRRLFGEGALAAAFVPEYTALERDDVKASRALASLVVARLTVIMGIIVLVGELILFGVATQFDEPNLAVQLTMIMLPFAPMVCVMAILGAMLQVHGRFGPPAAAPIVLNVCVIGAALGLAPALATQPTLHVAWVAGGVVVAGVAQLGWSFLALRGRSWWTADFEAGRAAARRLIVRAVPMIVGLGVLQLNTLFDGLIASYPTAVGPTIAGVAYPLEEGAMAAVSFAQRLYQFPLGVFGIAIATAIFPQLARESGDDAAFTDTLRRGLRLVLFIGLPASVGLMLVREPLAAVILEGGDFTRDDSMRVSRVLLGYASAVWAYSMMHVLTRAFYARDDARTPVRIAIGVVGLNLALNCVLIWTPLREAGLAWSTAVCALVQVLALTWAMRLRLGPVIDRAVLGGWGRSLAATLVMAIVVIVARVILPDPDRWIVSLGVLVTAVMSGAIAYGAVAATVRMPELRWCLGREADPPA